MAYWNQLIVQSGGLSGALLNDNHAAPSPSQTLSSSSLPILSGILGSSSGNDGNDLLGLDLGLLEDDGLLDLGVSILGGGSASDTANGLLDLGVGIGGDDSLLDVDLGVGGDDGLIDLDADIGGSDGLVDVDLDVGGDDDGPTPGDGDLDPEVDPADFEVVLSGTDGDDTFQITAQSTFVDGRDGLDIAVYAASASEFSYQLGNDAALFSNGTKVDYLADIERVEFLEGTLALDVGVGETAGFVYRVYQAAYDRTPDDAGVKFWIDAVDDGLDFNSVANGFLQSNEFEAVYGVNPSNETYVEMLYENVLGRAPDVDGSDFWVDALDDGSISRAQVLVGFAESSENVELVASVIGDGFFLS